MTDLVRNTAALRADLEAASLAATQIRIKVVDKTKCLKLTGEAKLFDKVPNEHRKRVKAEEKLLENGGAALTGTPGRFRQWIAHPCVDDAAHRDEKLGQAEGGGPQ